MRCPNCGAKLDEEVLAAIEVAIAFRYKRVGFKELKAAAENLERLRNKYKEESHG
jgi:hypothetical protein